MRVSCTQRETPRTGAAAAAVAASATDRLHDDNKTTTAAALPAGRTAAGWLGDYHRTLPRSPQQPRLLKSTAYLSDAAAATAADAAAVSRTSAMTARTGLIQRRYITTTIYLLQSFVFVVAERNIKEQAQKVTHDRT